MTSNDESIFFVSSQTTSFNPSKKSDIASIMSENLSEEKSNNLFGFIKELAIKNDLPLPHKEKDSEISINKFSVLDQKSEFETKKEKIDEDMLNEVFKILSKYTH